MNFLIRYGPSPGDTMDENGNIHAKLDNYFILPIKTNEVEEMFGTADTNATNPNKFMEILAITWRQIIERGCGHMLVGAYSSFRYTSNEEINSCGFNMYDFENNMTFAPDNYVPLYCVFNGGGTTLGIDYRNTSGPNDESIKPVIFNVDIGDETSLPDIIDPQKR